MKNSLTIAALALLTGCATCDRHPTACWAAAGVAAGAVAASTNHRVPVDHSICGANREKCR